MKTTNKRDEPKIFPQNSTKKKKDEGHENQTQELPWEDLLQNDREEMQHEYIIILQKTHKRHNRDW